MNTGQATVEDMSVERGERESPVLKGQQELNGEAHTGTQVLGCNGGSAGIRGGDPGVSIYERGRAQGLAIGWVGLKGSVRS